MTFEEQFPSLKEQSIQGCADDFYGDEQYLFTDETIQKFCLDKQRVKEAIRKAGITEMPSGDSSDFLIKSTLLKELGL